MYLSDECLVESQRTEVEWCCSIIFRYQHKAVAPFHSFIQPNSTIICCFCSGFNSFFKGSCSTYATHLSGAWYGFTPSFTHNENIPLKYPITENTSANSLCLLFVILALTFTSASCLTLQWNCQFYVSISCQWSYYPSIFCLDKIWLACTAHWSVCPSCLALLHSNSQLVAAQFQHHGIPYSAGPPPRCKESALSDLAFQI